MMAAAAAARGVAVYARHFKGDDDDERTCSRVSHYFFIQTLDKKQRRIIQEE